MRPLLRCRGCNVPLQEYPGTDGSLYWGVIGSGHGVCRRSSTTAPGTMHVPLIPDLTNPEEVKAWLLTC